MSNSKNMHKKSIYCSNDYRAINKPTTFTFPSLSPSSTPKQSEFVYINNKSLRKEVEHTRSLKENSSQTSKTILELAKIEKREMSPDSLSGSLGATHCLSESTLKESCPAQNSYSLNSSPLTQMFLQRSRNKTSPIQCFVKSRSFVDHCQQSNLGPVFFKSIVLPDNALITKRQNSTLMQPTASSEIKSQMEDVQSVSKLLPKVRKGRSTSPKLLVNKSRYGPLEKIPYIDQCKSTVSSSTTLINTARHPNRLQELFNENFLKTDVNTIEQKLSELSLDKPHSAIIENTICLAINKLRDPDWRISLRGLAEVVEIARLVDVDVIDDYMSCINQRVIELLRSPRSHVCRIACQAVGHLFEYVKDTRRPEFDEIVDLLLHKTADANKFIRQDANLALDCMVTHINIFNSVKVLCSKGPTHKNSLVRCATVRLLVCVVVIATAAFILNPNNNEFTRKRVIVHMARFLDDKNLDTRKMAERLFKILCKEDKLEGYLKKYLTTDQIAKIKKTFKLIHKK